MKGQDIELEWPDCLCVLIDNLAAQVWTLDQQYQHCLGSCQKCKKSGSTADPLNQNLQDPWVMFMPTGKALERERQREGKEGQTEKKRDRVGGGREGKRSGWLRLGWGLRRDLKRGGGKKKGYRCFSSVQFQYIFYNCGSETEASMRSRYWVFIMCMTLRCYSSLLF